MSNMEKTKVAHLIYSKKVGGSEMIAATICSQLDRDLYDPMLLFLYAPKGEMDIVAKELQIPAYSCNLNRYNKIFRSYYLPKFFKKLKIDILHIHHIPLYLTLLPSLKKSNFKGVVVTEHAKYSISKSPQLQKAAQHAAKHVAHLTVVSQDLKNYFTQNLGIAEHVIQVIPNAIDTEKFSSRQQIKIADNLLPENFTGTVLLTVGRLAEAKDHKTLFRALVRVKEQNPDFILLIAGDGELSGQLHSLRTELNLEDHIHFLGTRTDINILMQLADIFILSSKREGLPMVILEAMASGIPIIATKVGGIPEVISDGETGLLVNSEDPSQLETAIKALMTNCELTSKLTNKSRQKIVHEYSLARIANSYMAIYKNVLDNR